MDSVCFWCGEEIDTPYVTMPHLPDHGPVENKRYHRNCFVRMIVGGVNHQRGDCACCGGTDDPDPPNMTTRQAADAAARNYHGQSYSFLGSDKSKSR